MPSDASRALLFRAAAEPRLRRRIFIAGFVLAVVLPSALAFFVVASAVAVLAATAAAR
eukprot:CAMPEP_0172321178 /NCGR_PEP_ID=MMETSP1058-20130122/42610_1 /TAXON_ID=83371 /ORGANISM="Detonula confervacea, Strain CCMP 353" /LENGTH=57 /DNA_ID=CAMNT_0013036615 /DNA_START=92 /DNA_END=262 /DNA_ORIENTATION=-